MRPVKSEHPHLHVVRHVLKDGSVEEYRYHRLSKVRIFAAPGDPEFAAQYELAARGHRTPKGRRRQARQRAATRLRNRVYIYFIHAAASARVKIVRAKDPKRRLAVLQTGSAEPLRLITAVLDKSGGELERDFHRLLAGERIKGEWFRASESVLRLAEVVGRRTA